ncbi:SUMO1 sentrin specific peptidase 1 [Dimargaris verticillata]|uniref:SUMO1 sentrin specific peptidase 1 n=1 Tax=Dimargaris verticillata TaxID=2761393 RepID=A0A9W8B2H5_9FUNG|nr:SUMO1 sentrin specific peptidase 1 [Dimargaris verticillata]
MTKRMRASEDHVYQTMGDAPNAAADFGTDARHPSKRSRSGASELFTKVVGWVKSIFSEADSALPERGVADIPQDAIYDPPPHIPGAWPGRQPFMSTADLLCHSATQPAPARLKLLGEKSEATANRNLSRSSPISISSDSSELAGPPHRPMATTQTRLQSMIPNVWNNSATTFLWARPQSLANFNKVSALDDRQHLPTRSPSVLSSRRGSPRHRYQPRTQPHRTLYSPAIRKTHARPAVQRQRLGELISLYSPTTTRTRATSSLASRDSNALQFPLFGTSTVASRPSSQSLLGRGSFAARHTLSSHQPSSVATPQLFSPSPASLTTQRLDSYQWLSHLATQVRSSLAYRSPVPSIARPETPQFTKLLAKEAHLNQELAKLQVAIPTRPTVDNFPPLPPTALDEIQRALHRPLVVEAFNIPIRGTDLVTLTKDQWLNDEVINFYFSLIVARSQDSNHFPSLHTFNTFFYPKLCDQGYRTVRRWTKRVDIFAKDMVILPIHLPAHWTCAVINFTRKRIEYYDSMLMDNPTLFATLREYLQAEHLDKKQADFDLSGWTDWCPKDIPRQYNGFDCGVFACIFAEFASREEPFTFDQGRMKYLRQRMMYEILHTRLLVQA